MDILCVCVCACACVRAFVRSCVRACVCVCGEVCGEVSVQEVWYTRVRLPSMGIIGFLHSSDFGKWLIISVGLTNTTCTNRNTPCAYTSAYTHYGCGMAGRPLHITHVAWPIKFKHFNRINSGMWGQWTFKLLKCKAASISQNKVV